VSRRGEEHHVEGDVVGAIRARLEDDPLHTEPETVTNASENSVANTANVTTRVLRRKRLYIQTLLLLSPYRSHGVAAAMLSSLLSTLHTLEGDLDNVAVQAHVHETNTEALEWYQKRGFTVQEKVVENYYRRLKPSGAWIVRMEVMESGEVEGEGEVERESDGNGRVEKGEGVKQKREEHE